MGSKWETTGGHIWLPPEGGAGDVIACEARREIERLGLEDEYTVVYMADQNAIRLGRPGPEGVPTTGIDYPAHPDWLSVLTEHLRVLARAGSV